LTPKNEEEFSIKKKNLHYIKRQKEIKYFSFFLSSYSIKVNKYLTRKFIDLNFLFNLDQEITKSRQEDLTGSFR